MASAQSSQDMCRGRQPQTLGNAQPRHRSESPFRDREPEDPRWLLSCKYDRSRECGYVARLIVMMLGENVVNNPNRFSKSCCTIGDRWDETYNQGENKDKYLRCWEPNAPDSLLCTKPVTPGKEPTEHTCWKSSYFWRVKKSRKTLRVIEDGQLGEGQQIEKSMANLLGCEVVEVKIDGVAAEEEEWEDFCRVLAPSEGPGPPYLMAVQKRVIRKVVDEAAPQLRRAGFRVQELNAEYLVREWKYEHGY